MTRIPYPECLLAIPNAMVARGVEPYPMVYERATKPDLRKFQRWVITGLYRAVPFADYDVSFKVAEANMTTEMEFAL